MKNQWIRTLAIKPDSDRIVEAKDSGGYVQKLRFYKNLWWFADMSMYVYFVPEYWREVQ